MDAEAKLRLVGCELRKLKETRTRDATRLKAAALKAKNKALAEERRAHNACGARLKREVEDLTVIVLQHTKDVKKLEK